MGKEHEFTVPLVSILIPVKNGALFLLEAVESCLEQETTHKYEIVLIDDYSTDATPEIITQLSDEYPFIRGLINNGHGVGNALQTGLLAAAGEIVLRLDSDDRMSPHRLEMQVERLLSDSQLVLCGSQIELFGDEPIAFNANFYPLAHDEICKFMQSGNAFADPSVAFRRSSAILVGGFATKLNGAEQYSLWLRMSKVGKLCNMPEALTNYRIHSSQFTQSKVSKVVFTTIAVQSLWAFGVTQLRLKFRLGLQTGLESGVGRFRIFGHIPRYLTHVIAAWVRK
jgi:hypothetical protein